MWLFKKYGSRIQQDFYERQKSEIFFKEIVELLGIFKIIQNFRLYFILLVDLRNAQYNDINNKNNVYISSAILSVFSLIDI